MARAFPASEAPDVDYAPQPDDWQALRGELVALLDQVEGKYVGGSGSDPRYTDLAERMADLRVQIGDTGHLDRHKEALASVRRTVNRFNDRSAATDYETDSALDAAIEEIRGRKIGFIPDAGPSPARLAGFTQAMTSVADRLGQIEVDLHAQRGNASHIKEIADQVSQLSHVVELLAGAVGETGQVKRLEGQIAGLSRMLEESPKADLTALTQRLDEVAGTVERLADLQVQQIQHVVREAEASPQKDLAITEAMGEVEASVRQVYDRLDTMERSMNVPQAEIERLGATLARFTNEMRASTSQPDSLLGLVDALNARVSDIEARGDDARALKDDLAELRRAVLGALEPRLGAIESQIETLGGKISEQHDTHTGIAQIESQIRQLMARMDQTGQQLSGLGELYSRAGEATPAPDFEGLADLVARRTSDAVAKSNAKAGALAAPTGLSEAELAKIEARMSRLLESAVPRPASLDIAGMTEGFRAVNERLARLEKSLTAPAAMRATAEPGKAEIGTPVDNVGLPTNATTPIRESEPVQTAAESASSQHRTLIVKAEPAKDVMPRNPGEDGPLREFSFPDLGPVRAALEAKSGPRRVHPGLDTYEAELSPAGHADDTQAPTPDLTEGVGLGAPRDLAPPQFDPETVERPQPPRSHLDTPDDIFGFEAGAQQGDGDEARQQASSATSRNTFIEAARRAAQRQTSANSQSNANSLIGRALARFHSEGEAVAEAEPVALSQVAGVPDEAKPVEKRARLKWPRLGKSPAPGASTLPEAVEPEIFEAAPTSSLFDVPDDTGDVTGVSRESFLLRNRKPILLLASLVAVSFMTLNLVMEHQGSTQTRDQGAAPITQTKPTIPVEADPTSAPPPSTRTGAATPTSDVMAPEANVPDQEVAETRPDATAPDAAKTPALDTLTTGSIPPAAVPALAAANPDQALPSSLSATAFSKAGNAPVISDSPVKVDLPPSSVGPLDLRQAAANGDPRAQFEIGAIYSEGRAVPTDFKAASKWYERAAAQGFAPAQYRLASLYESGKGVKKDLEEARLWYQRAAEAGNRMAMHNLAALYAGGQLGKQNFASAAEWFEQAANRDVTDSQFNLGMLYARGLGVPQNLETSYKWFSLAARDGDKGAIKARDDMAKSLGAAAVKEVKTEIANWKPANIIVAANYAPVGTWDKDFDPGQAITNKSVVTKVQTALMRLGFDVGTPDGSVGPKTSEAIKAFEHATGMSEVGQVNPRLLAVLGSQPV